MQQIAAATPGRGGFILEITEQPSKRTSQEDKERQQTSCCRTRRTLPSWLKGNLGKVRFYLFFHFVHLSLFFSCFNVISWFPWFLLASIVVALFCPFSFVSFPFLSCLFFQFSPDSERNICSRLSFCVVYLFFVLHAHTCLESYFIRLLTFSHFFPVRFFLFVFQVFFTCSEEKSSFFLFVSIFNHSLFHRSRKTFIFSCVISRTSTNSKRKTLSAV